MRRVSVILEGVRLELGVTPEVFWEMTMSQLASLRAGIVTGCKWTRGELARAVEEKDGDTALEILQYLYERGPRVVDWSDERVPCGNCQRLEGHSQRCEDRRRAEMVGEDTANRTDSST